MHRPIGRWIRRCPLCDRFVSHAHAYGDDAGSVSDQMLQKVALIEASLEQA